MTYHDEYIELISAALDGALSPAQQEKLEAHLASCPECKALHEELAAVHAALSDLPPVEVPADLTDRIMAAVAAEQVLPFAPPEKKKPSLHWQRWLASAAVLAVVVMGAWSWKPWERTDRNPPLQASQSVEAVTADTEAVVSGSGNASGANNKIAPQSADPEVLPETASLDGSEPVAPAESAPIPRSADDGNANSEEEKDKITVANGELSSEMGEADAAATQTTRSMGARMDESPALRSAPAPQTEPGENGTDVPAPTLFSSLPAETPEETEPEAPEAADPPTAQPFMVMASGIPAGIPEDTGTETPLTAREALDLVAEYCFGNSGYEMLREELEGDVPSAHFSLLDGVQPFAGGTILYTGEDESFFRFECHWDDDPENPYHYSVHKTERYVAWQGEVPIDGEYLP